MIDLIAVYRSPGPHWGPPGKTYDSRGVEPGDLQQAIAEGWSESYLAALGMEPADAAADAAEHASVVTFELEPEPAAEPDPEPVDDNAAPTRAEMEQQAALLGIDVDGRWSDKTLLAKIAAATDPT
jgi:hypothetical protein